MKLIALAGRKGSGKTELAKVCEKLGFKRVFFAFALKNLISELCGFNIDSSQEIKDKEINLVLNGKQINYLAKETSISREYVKQTVGNITIKTVRDALQIIGTNLIRKYNPNFHVDKLKELILSNTNINYCIDDLRFPNELNMVNELGGTAWFVVRPIINNISNHESETSLRWQDFGNNILVNNAPLSNLQTKWDYFVTYTIITNEPFTRKIFNCNNFIELREKICDELASNKEKTFEDKINYITEKYKCSESYIKAFISILNIPYHKFILEKNYQETFNCIDFKNDKTIKLKQGILYNKMNGKKHIITDNPLIIEDIKFLL